MNDAANVVLGAALVGSLLSISACRKAPQPGEPVNGLTREQREQFERGRVEFERSFTPGAGARDRFRALSEADRAALLSFLRSR